MPVMRFDRGTVHGKAVKTDEGYIRADAAVTRTGVFVYRNPDGTVRRELRHPDEVFQLDSLQTLRMVPLTNGHPTTRMLNADSAKQFSIGTTGENIRPNGKFVMAPLVVTDSTAVQDVDALGKRQLSCGYLCDLVQEDGTYGGERYDWKQTNIRYNHVALCREGRAGEGVGINLDSLDEGDGVEIDAPKEDSTQTRRSSDMPKITLDGIDYEAAPEVINRLHKVTGENTDLSTKLDAATKENEGLKGERDSLKEENETLKKRDIKADVAEAVKGRLALERTAREFLSDDKTEKLDEMSDSDILKAVVLVKFPEAKLDEATDEYLTARFDAAVELLKTEKGDEGIKGQREKSTPKSHSEPHADSEDAARERYHKRLRGEKVDDEK